MFTRSPVHRFVLAAAALIAGEAAAFALPGLAPAWRGVGLFLLLALLAAYGWGARHLLAPALAALGFTLALRADAGLAELLARETDGAGLHADLALQVEGPVHRRPGREGGCHVDFHAQAGPVPLKVVLPVPRNGTVPSPGERWTVSGRLSRREDRGNRFARRTLWVPAPELARRTTADGADGVAAGWARLVDGLSRLLGYGLEWNPELAGLNRAILLGARDEIPRLRRQAFVDAGTIHVFAISGLHVMVVAWMLNACLLRFEVPLRVRGLVCLPPLWAYVVLTGAHPSAVRAALMATFCLLATVLGRRPDMLAAWAQTALLVYVLRPERLFDLGCTFSFAVMLGIAVWLRVARRCALPVLDGRPGLRRLAGEFGVSLAAWAAGVPIAAHVFGRVTPGGLLANFVVLRCARPLVQFGVGAMLAGVLSAPLAALLNNAAAACAWTMAAVSELVSRMPFASVEVDPWSPAQCIAWYAGCLGLLAVAPRWFPRTRTRPGRWWR